jgi:hypothetical protein
MNWRMSRVDNVRSIFVAVLRLVGLGCRGRKRLVIGLLLRRGFVARLGLVHRLRWCIGGSRWSVGRLLCRRRFVCWLGGRLRFVSWFGGSWRFIGRLSWCLRFIRWFGCSISRFRCGGINRFGSIYSNWSRRGGCWKVNRFLLLGLVGLGRWCTVGLYRLRCRVGVSWCLLRC